jgi:hypothetical protein
MADDLLELQKDHRINGDPRWGICGVGLMPWDKKMYDALYKQVWPDPIEARNLSLALRGETQ